MLDRLKKQITDEIMKLVEKKFKTLTEESFKKASENNQNRLEELLINFQKDLKETVKIEVEKQLNEKRF